MCGRVGALLAPVGWHRIRLTPAVSSVGIENLGTGAHTLPGVASSIPTGNYWEDGGKARIVAQVPGSLLVRIAGVATLHDLWCCLAVVLTLNWYCGYIQGTQRAGMEAAECP